MAFTIAITLPLLSQLIVHVVGAHIPHNACNSLSMLSLLRQKYVPISSHVRIFGFLRKQLPVDECARSTLHP